MEFEQIAEKLGLSKREVIRIYENAIRKLKAPNEKNRKFWDYININLEDKDRDGIISTE
jgi:DNA-directed RNA polymerase sigma subunit (sigma70/sigma32)